MFFYWLDVSRVPKEEAPVTIEVTDGIASFFIVGILSFRRKRDLPPPPSFQSILRLFTQTTYFSTSHLENARNSRAGIGSPLMYGRKSWRSFLFSPRSFLELLEDGGGNGTVRWKELLIFQSVKLEIQNPPSWIIAVHWCPLLLLKIMRHFDFTVGCCLKYSGIIFRTRASSLDGIFFCRIYWLFSSSYVRLLQWEKYGLMF